MYWLAESVQRALSYEKQMERIASTPVELEDESTEVQDPPAARSKTAPEMVGQIFPFPDPDTAGSQFIATDRRVVGIYHDDAVKVAGVHWCRVDGCMHRAPADGDCCPVHKDMGILPVYGPQDAA